MNEYEGEVDRDNGLGFPAPNETPGQARLRQDASPIMDDMVVPVTDDGFESSVDVYGTDVINTGMASDAGLGGYNTDIDRMPGDETPITPGGAR